MEDNYAKLADERHEALFSQLHRPGRFHRKPGLSIGIMEAWRFLRSRSHMSAVAGANCGKCDSAAQEGG